MTKTNLYFIFIIKFTSLFRKLGEFKICQRRTGLHTLSLAAALAFTLLSYSNDQVPSYLAPPSRLSSQ